MLRIAVTAPRFPGCLEDSVYSVVLFSQYKDGAPFHLGTSYLLVYMIT